MPAHRSLVPAALLSALIGLAGCHISFGSSSSSGSTKSPSSSQGKPTKKSPSKATPRSNNNAKPVSKASSKPVSKPKPAAEPTTTASDPERNQPQTDPERNKPQTDPKRTKTDPKRAKVDPKRAAPSEAPNRTVRPQSGTLTTKTASDDPKSSSKTMRAPR